jgi:isopentenyl-diphosphate delta-isomerase
MARQSNLKTYSMLDQNETVILVDTKNREIGSCGKLTAHHAGKLHRAFSILITNPQGEILLQQRAAQKYHFANRWSNTCCGHPRLGEDTLAAAVRRLDEELGFKTLLMEVANLSYRAFDPASGLIEHEHLHVFFGQYDGEISPNPVEVNACRWMLPNRIRRSLAICPDRFTPWFALLASRFIRDNGFSQP